MPRKAWGGAHSLAPPSTIPPKMQVLTEARGATTTTILHSNIVGRDQCLVAWAANRTQACTTVKGIISTWSDSLERFCSFIKVLKPVHPLTIFVCMPTGSSIHSVSIISALPASARRRLGVQRLHPAHAHACMCLASIHVMIQLDQKQTVGRCSVTWWAETA